MRYYSGKPTKTLLWQAVFFMGPGGSGKGFVRKSIYGKYMDFTTIDPDKFKEEHPEYDPEKPFLLHEWSSSAAKSLWRDILKSGSGQSFVYDGTGANTLSLAKKIAETEKAGYNVTAVYVKVPAAVSLFRNRNRKRFVPEDVILTQVENIERSFAAIRKMGVRTKIIPNYDRADLQEAEADLAMYPAPQKERPPRPGDPDYGMQAAASNTEWLQRFAARNKHLPVGWEIKRLLSSKPSTYEGMIRAWQNHDRIRLARLAVQTNNAKLAHSLLG